jgi:tetratricopeptide (TPR) repeat protein
MFPTSKLSLLCLLLCGAAFGQYKNIDSLKTRLSETSGKDRADVLLNLTKSVYKKDPAAGKKYLDELEPLAKSLNYDLALATAIEYSGRIDLNKKEYDNALAKFKDSKDRAATLKNVKLLTENYGLMGALYQETGKLNELNGVFENLQPYKTTREGQEAIAKVIKSRALYYYYKINYKEAKEEFKKAHEMFEKLNDQANIAGTGMNVGVLEYKLGDIKQSIATMEESMVIAKKIRDTLLIADCLSNIALSEFALGNIEKSITQQEQANKLYLQVNNTNRYQSGILNMSSNLMSVGKHAIALNYLLSVLDNSRKNNDQYLIALCYRTLADLHLNNNDTSKALQYLNDGLELSKKSKLAKEEASFLRGLGQIETHRRHYEQAATYLTQSEAIYTSLNVPREIDAIYTSLGNLYLRKKEYAKAEEYYLKSLEIGKKMGAKNSIAGMYSNLGVIHYEQGDFDKSIDYYTQSLEIRKQINNPYMIADSYVTLSNSYYSKKDYEKSYDYYKKYHLLLDSVRNVSSKKEIADMQTKYESKEKEQQIDLLSKDKALKHYYWIKTQKNCLLSNFLIIINAAKSNY